MRRDAPARLQHPRGVDRLRDDLLQRNRPLLERPSFVESREQQQVLDEETHALRLACDPRHRPLEVVGAGRGTAREELGVGANGSQRRTQLMRCVGDEAPQLLLRCLACLERRLDLRQHGVQREPEPSNLCALVLSCDPVREIAGGDRCRRRTDLCQRPQSDPDHPEAEQRDPAQHCESHDQLDEDQLVERVVDTVKGGRDDEDEVAAPGICRRTNPVPAGALRRRHGEVADAVYAEARAEDNVLRQLRWRCRLRARELRCSTARDDRAVGAPHLDEETGDGPLQPVDVGCALRRRAGRATVTRAVTGPVQRAFRRKMRGVERVVGARDEEPTSRPSPTS